MEIVTSLAVAFLLAGVLAVSGQRFSCYDYKPDNPCTADAISFCLTNGTIITGRCHAQRAVCLEGATVDETFAACGKQGSNFDCSNYNPMVCTKDLIPFCLHNGTIVRGTCDAKRAVCQENQSVDDDFSACNAVNSREHVHNQQGRELDCANYNPMNCSTDRMQYCLTNGTAISGCCDTRQAVCLEGALVDRSLESCPELNNTFDCDTFNPVICSRDLIPCCLSNGTTIYGTCAARKAVCWENATVDAPYQKCPDARDKFNCDSFDPLNCTTDLFEFCLSNGTVVRGTCAAQTAVCWENAEVDYTFDSCPDESDRTIDCDAFDPLMCNRRDFARFCLNNGTLIQGTCQAKTAVCLENAEVDDTFAACLEEPDRFDCADPLKCTKDLIPFCLSNGTVVQGTCATKHAVCLENAEVDDTFDACLEEPDCAHPLKCTKDLIPFCLSNGTVVLGTCAAKQAVCLENATVDHSSQSCSKENPSFDCTDFNPMICARDLKQFCLTNGTMMNGSCAAKRAVCLENAEVDDSFDACLEEPDRFDCAHPLKCTKDLIPFCLSNGTVVQGTCAAKQAVCLENATVDPSFQSCSKENPSFDCADFNPMICARDLKQFCLTNGTMMNGSCAAKRAVCLENAEVDDTFAACLEEPDRFDCADPLKCTKDLIPFCLSNGTVVQGTCAAKQAVCLENAEVDDTFAACLEEPDRFDCAHPLKCTKDLIPFCLSNGTVVQGTCAAKHAVCFENQAASEDLTACQTSSTVTMATPAADGRSLGMDCSRYNPFGCSSDFISYCLANGTVVVGRCNAQKAVCGEHQSVDDSFTACNNHSTSSALSTFLFILLLGFMFCQHVLSFQLL